MSNELKNIDQLYQQAFANYTPNTTTVAWSVISKKAKLAKFMQFKALTFNVYYSSLIAASTVLGGITYYNNQSNPSPVPQKIITPIIQEDTTSLAEETLEIVDEIIQRQNTKETLISILPEETTGTAVESEASSLSKSTKEILDEEKVSASSNKRVKLVKYQTVIIQDTVVETRNRKKSKKRRKKD